MKLPIANVIQGISQFEQTLKHPVVTIGNFDGFHLGHQSIVQSAINEAKKRGGMAVAYTFRPHPQVALRPGAQIQLLCTYDEKIRLLSDFGLDLIIEEPFSREFSETDSHTFFSEVLLKKLGVEAIVVGYDFAFGKGREGHLENLEKFCKSSNVSLEVVQPLRTEGEIVSSSKIRAHLRSGEISIASRMLGRFFSYEGVIVRGAGRGNQLGFPTANLEIQNKLILPLGVYSTWAWIDGKKIPSVTNVGVRPTFLTTGQDVPPLIETHLLHTAQDLYGLHMKVEFVQKIRDEKKFDSIEHLKLQIQKDIEAAKIELQKN